jgi:hypothetical protein
MVMNCMTTFVAEHNARINCQHRFNRCFCFVYFVTKTVLMSRRVCLSEERSEMLLSSLLHDISVSVMSIIIIINRELK